MMIKRSKSLLFILILTVLYACGSDKTAEDFYQDAVKDYEAGDVASSLIHLKNAVQLDGDHAEARFMLGQVFHQTGESEKALRQLEKAKELGIDDPELDIFVYRSLLATNNTQRLLNLSPAADDADTTAEILTLRTYAWLAQDEIDTAKAELASALELDPEYFEARLVESKIAMFEQRSDESRSLLKKLMQDAPEFADGWLFDGQIKLGDKDYEAAKTSFSEALKYSKNPYQPRLGLIRSLLAMQSWEQAEQEINQLGKENPGNAIVNYFRGYLEFERDNLEKAKEELTRVFTVAPDYPLSSLLLATIHYREGDYLLADEQIKRYLVKAGNNLAAVKLAAAIQVKLGKPEKAIDLMIPLAEEGDNDVQFLSMLGNAYMLVGNPEESTYYLQKAAELSPEQSDIKTELALSQYQTGNVDNALEVLDTVIELDPELVKAAYLKVMINLKQENFHEVLKDVERALKREPDNANYYNLQGAAYLGLKDYERTRSSLEKALELQPEFIPAMINLALLDLQNNDPESAVEQYQRILAINPNNVRAHVGLARVDFDKGKQKAAIKRLESVRSDNASALSPRIILARYYLRMNDIAQAEKVAKEIRLIAPNRIDTMMIVGQVSRSTGQYQDAVDIFETLAEKQPDTVSILYELGYSLIRVGRFEDARQALDKLLEIDPENIPAIKELISIDVYDKEYDQAIKLAERVRAFKPDSPEADAIIGDIYIARGEIQNGITAYEKAYSIQKTGFLTVKLHKTYLANGDSERGYNLMKSWIENHPGDTSSKVYLADSYMQAENYQEALPLYEDIVKKQPNMVVALNNLAYIYDEKGDQRGLTTAERAFKLAPQVAGVADTYAWILIKRGKLEQGISILEPFIADQNIHPTILYHYAYALSESGNTGPARKAIRRALDLKQPFPEQEQSRELLSKLDV